MTSLLYTTAVVPTAVIEPWVMDAYAARNWSKYPGPHSVLSKSTLYTITILGEQIARKQWRQQIDEVSEDLQPQKNESISVGPGLVSF